MAVVVSATAVESQVTLHVIVPVVGVPVAADSMTVEADQVSTHHHLKQFYCYYGYWLLTIIFLKSIEVDNFIFYKIVKFEF